MMHGLAVLPGKVDALQGLWAAGLLAEAQQLQADWKEIHFCFCFCFGVINDIYEVQCLASFHKQNLK